MPPVYLTSGAYQSRSVIANAQRCVNLYPETNPAATTPPAPTTHYQRPGKTLVGIPPALDLGRGMYCATNGDLFVVIGDTVYYVDSNFTFSAVGTVNAGTSIVSMADNGEDVGDAIVVVDGSTGGWEITMSTRTMAAIVDGTGTFVGSNRVDYLQGFFLFNAPNTPYWYVSEPYSVTFNALDVATKASYADNIATLGVRQREVWLIGAQTTTEPWFLSGNASFAFEAVPSALIPYGCIATYSMQSIDAALFWLTRDLKGDAIIVQSKGYEAVRISTHALEVEMQGYDVLSDAIGTSYQIGGHVFYVLSFPDADKTWAYDLATQQWHQLMWLDNEGDEHRDRAVTYVNAYGKLLAQDWEHGYIYEVSNEVYQDNGESILFIRSFPHVLSEMKRITHWSLVADIQCGATEDNDEEPILMMRYSDDRGRTWSDPSEMPLGDIGETYGSPQFTRLGMARDRVYELSWNANAAAPLNGVYIEVEKSET